MNQGVAVKKVGALLLREPWFLFYISQTAQIEQRKTNMHTECVTSSEEERLINSRDGKVILKSKNKTFLRTPLKRRA